MIVFAHTKFSFVRIQGSKVKRGAESAPPVRANFSNPDPDRVKSHKLPSDVAFLWYQ